MSDTNDKEEGFRTPALEKEALKTSKEEQNKKLSTPPEAPTESNDDGDAEEETGKVYGPIELPKPVSTLRGL